MLGKRPAWWLCVSLEMGTHAWRARGWRRSCLLRRCGTGIVILVATCWCKVPVKGPLAWIDKASDHRGGTAGNGADRCALELAAQAVNIRRGTLNRRRRTRR